MQNQAFRPGIFGVLYLAKAMQWQQPHAWTCRFLCTPMPRMHNMSAKSRQSQNMSYLDLSSILLLSETQVCYTCVYTYRWPIICWLILWGSPYMRDACVQAMETHWSQHVSLICSCSVYTPTERKRERERVSVCVSASERERERERERESERARESERERE